MAINDELIRASAVEVVDALRRGDVSTGDLLSALDARIEAVDEAVNALPRLCLDRANAHARRLNQRPARDRGRLCGLPIAIKDLTEVAGVRTTHGSKLYQDHVSEQSDMLIDALEAEGGIVYAKSNTPEFGVGGNTFNDVYGATRNPHDLRMSAGGSSGGAAAALASGTAWLATGSDMGGSLRTPASFCGVASLRPSPWLIQSDPGPLPFQTLAVDGPMARGVVDLALFAEAMANGPRWAPGADPGFQAAAVAPDQPARIAYSADLGLADVDPEVRALCQSAVEALDRDGSAVEEIHPDLAEAHDAFWTLRGVGSALSFGSDLVRIRDVVKPELTLDIERGLALDGAQIRDALAKQGRIVAEGARFMADYDLLICPAAAVKPYPVEERYPGFSDGVPFERYLRWLELAYAITTTALPVITVPCGTTADGLPVGLQLIGKPYGEKRLFALARHVEQVLGWDQTPVDPR